MKKKPYRLAEGFFGVNVVNMEGTEPRIIGKITAFGEATLYTHLSEDNVPICRRRSGKQFRVSLLESTVLFENDKLYFPIRRSSNYFELQYTNEHDAARQTAM